MTRRLDRLARGLAFLLVQGPGIALLLGAAGSPAAAKPTSDDGVVRFTWPDTTARSVFLVGDFNGWSATATPLDREDSAWVTRVFLDPGVYEYQFHVDGAWCADPDNPERSSKGHSVLRVGTDGGVMPPRPTAASAGDSTAAVRAGGPDLLWQLRYVGLVTARRDRAVGRWDLDRPLHDVDLRIEPRIAPELSGWLLAHLDNRDDSSTDGGGSSGGPALRFERGLLLWSPDPYAVRLFDDVGVAAFDDPGALVGRIGIYADPFGYGRRGVDIRRRILGAPIELLYADDLERRSNRAPTSALPALDGPGALALGGTTVRRYTTSSSERGADALALRARLGTDRAGLGFGYRLDRGGAAGRLAVLDVVRTTGDTLVGTGSEFETRESWQAWAVDARTRWHDVRLRVEFLAGASTADAVLATSILDLRAAPGDTLTRRRLGEPAASDTEFDLDTSRRVVVELARPRGEGGTASAATWDARPGTGAVAGPELAYEYEEHDFAAPVTGDPFLLRRHAVRGGLDGRPFGMLVRLDLEQHWFEYPAAATWETQPWFRRWNFWLDGDVAGLDRLPLLGTDRAAVARLHLEKLLWAERGLQGALHATWSAPGFDRAPRYLEEIVRFAVPLRGKLALRTHSRVATYRTLDTDAPSRAALGSGAHLEAGLVDLAGATRAERGWRTRSAHFVELVYAVTPRSDVALGFGVDPIVIYETTNEYAPIGWDQFLFERGASPADAFAHPAEFARRLEVAERALERERRLALEVRLRF